MRVCNHRSIRRIWVAGLLAGLMAQSPASRADSYPSQPVKVIVQSPVGNGPDATARLLGERLSEIWQQNVVIINRPGGAGLIAAQDAVRAKPDGYTLYMPNSSTFLVLPALHEAPPIELGKDFSPIGLVGEGPILLAVAPSLGVNSIAELIALAKEQPGKIFHSALSIGTVPHLTGELFKKRAGIQMLYVPYLSSSKAVQDVAAGSLGVMFDGSHSLAGPIQSGTVKPIGISSPSRLPQFPDLPAIAETLPGFTALSWLPLLAPAGTPEPIIRKVNADLNAALRHPRLLERFHALGITARPMSPENLGVFIRSEQKAWRPIVDEADLKSK